MSESAYEHKELNMAVSEPISNPWAAWAELALEEKAYSAAYRALCRLRIEIASLYEEKAWSKVDWVPHEKCKKNAEFWARSGAYWKKKLEESLCREKDYLEGKWMDDPEFKAILAMRYRKYIIRNGRRQVIARYGHSEEDD